MGGGGGEDRVGVGEGGGGGGEDRVGLGREEEGEKIGWGWGGGRGRRKRRKKREPPQGLAVKATAFCAGRQGFAFRQTHASFSFSSRWRRSARKGPYALRPVSQQSPQGCPRNSVNVCLVEHRSFSTLEGGMSAASFLHSSFLQKISAVVLWPVHVQKVSQASERLCPAKLQTRYDNYMLCLPVYLPVHSL